MINKKWILLAALSLSFTAAAEENQIQKIVGNSLTPIQLSNRSVNDVLCQNGEAIDFYAADNVPVVVNKIPDSSGWIVTFQYLQNENNPTEIRYFGEEVEMYFVCSTGTYKSTIKPVHSKSKTVILSDGGAGKISSNIELIRGRDIEEVAVEFALQIINDNGSGTGLPDSYTIKKASPDVFKWHENIIAGISLRPERSVKIDGIGLRANEYSIRADRNVELKHVNFLKTPLGANIFTITPEDTKLIKGQMTTVVITHLERGI